MPGRGEAVAARARSLVGSRYRPQGRRSDLGLDCVGVAAVALSLDADRLPHGYALRGSSLSQLEAALRSLGLVPRGSGDLEPGDVLVFRPGAAQLHLAVFTGTGFVHADAGLRTVVERPLPAPWPVAGIWRAGDALRGNAQWPLSS
jgi:cell wall-associated NlpC family hydrolase